MKTKIIVYVGKNNLKKWEDKRTEHLMIYRDKGKLDDWMTGEHPPIKIIIEIPKEKK